VIVSTGTQPIRYLTRKDYLARYPGVTPVRAGDHPALLSVRVDNLAACEALLKKNDVKPLKPDAIRLLVPPSEAAHLTDGHTLDARGVELCFDLVQLKGFNDRFNFFHGPFSSGVS